jgi:hypothetical protein
LTGEWSSLRRTAEEPPFNSLIEQNHNLGYQQPVGEHLKYIGCERNSCS